MALVTITFTTSPSHLFPVALKIAAQAENSTEESVGKVKQYTAAFGAIREQAELAVALLQHLDNLKGVLVHAGGRLTINHEAVIGTLGCYIAAHAGGGIDGYCRKSITVSDPEYERAHMLDMAYVPPPRYVVPCAKLLRAGFVPDVQAKNIEKQVLAEAARQGCDWCPNFQPNSKGGKRK
jgi:hypothetical protein